MPLDPRIIILFGANVLLLYLTLLVNSTLGAWSLYLILLGPMLVFPALYLRHRSYFICTALTGLWVDAALPTTFGALTLGFLFAGALIFQIRVRFRAEHNYHPILIAHGCNFFFIVLLTLSTGSDLLNASGFWIQAILTSLLSHLALLAVAPWFFDLQRLLFELFHLETEPEDFPIL
jgi:cell shape-determining protein MreD